MKSSTYFHSQATEYGLAHTGRRKGTARRMTLAKARFHLHWVISHCAMFLESWLRFFGFLIVPWCILFLDPSLLYHKLVTYHHL